MVERYTPIHRDAMRYEVTIEDPKVFTRPWRMSMPLYRRLEDDKQMAEFRCVEMVEVTIYGHLRKEPLVEHWEGLTMRLDVTRTVPPPRAAIRTSGVGQPARGAVTATGRFWERCPSGSHDIESDME